MGEHNYHPWFGSPEPCPALYIELTRPTEDTPFLRDLIAAVDTGAPLTAIPWKYKQDANLYPARQIKLQWPGYSDDRVPTYLVEVNAEGYRPELVEVVFDPTHSEYALIGRNLMKHWHVLLKGPEQVLEIDDQPR